MFYKESLISPFLICKICDCKLVDPIVLPCGKSICRKCVGILADTEKKYIKCENCEKNHEIPIDGFPLNQDLENIVNLKPENVSRNDLASNLKSISNCIIEKAEKLKLDLNIGETKIKAKCDKIRNEVQLSIEEAHLELDKIHEEFMNQIQRNEKQYLANYKLASQNKEDIEKILDKSNEYFAKSCCLLNQYVIDDQDLRNAIIEATQLLDNLEKESAKFLSTIYENKVQKFVRNKSPIISSLIGEIKLKEIELHKLEMSNIRILNLASQLNEAHEKKTYSISIIPSTGHFLIAYVNKNENINLVVLTSDGKILKEKKNIITDKAFSKLFYLKIIAAKDTIYLYTSELHANTTEKLSIIRSFAQNLCNLKQLAIKNSWLFDSFEDNCYAYCELPETNYGTVKMYNSNLDLVEEIGQSDSELPFYIPTNTETIFITDEFLISIVRIYKDTSELDEAVLVKLVDRINGNVVHACEIPCNDEYFIYKKKYICFFDSTECNLTTYNFYGDLISDIQYDKRLSGFHFNMAINSTRLHLFDHHQSRLIVFDHNDDCE